METPQNCPICNEELKRWIRHEKGEIRPDTNKPHEENTEKADYACGATVEWDEINGLYYAKLNHCKNWPGKLVNLLKSPS